MKRKISLVMVVSAVTNILLASIKIIIGILFSSGAVASDGIHSLSDLFTDLISIVGNILARKPADKEHPYGHGKIEYLTSLIIGMVVVFVGIKVIYNSFYHEVVIPSIMVALVTIVTIIAKLLLSNYIINRGKKYNNNILIASGKESRMDVISSIVVLVSVLFMQLGNKISIFLYSDKIASIIVGVFIIKAGYNILKDNASIVLGRQETDTECVSKIEKLIKNTKGVLDIKSLVIMKFGYKSSLTLTITMNGKTSISDAHKIADKIENKIRKYNEAIEYINIHIEPSK